ncbi:MAG: diguanylate cyclase [Cereibacter sphaeroides]|uniref:Diguanylate cyclase n=1 Tax=Cereibacter sphaeroides TaxID=1063 RepID=A0A2W5S6Z7_CERSP|nr:MAG: diguanylate cyclase [Cereibacter sphaeroides]
MVHDWVVGVYIALAAFAAALTGVALLVLFPQTKTQTGNPTYKPVGTIFIFDGETLVDASPGARALLSAAPVRGTPWRRLMAFLAPRFPGFEARLAGLAAEGRFVLASTDRNPAGPLTLQAEWRGGLSHITLAGVEHDGAIALIDPLAQRAMEEELALLRGTVAQAPLPIWLENAEREVIWANARYLRLAADRLGPEDELGWPLPRLMEVDQMTQGRLTFDAAHEPPLMFDATVRPAGDGRMIYATPVDALVQAENSLRDFTQTLTKTFAHLPIGLAIFDNQRQLALFNPALFDLSGLPSEFLIARPTLFDFLDRMRDRQMIPEPKDYPSWRAQIADLERAAVSGTYEETWDLPTGQTYRVMGRPHPDGAMALLFEDISTETSRTRRYRADLELGQSVIDAMDEAVAVFSSTGQLILSNPAYVDLWSHDPANSLDADSNIGALSHRWSGQTAPSSVWAEAEDFVLTFGPRKAWSAEARLGDGRLLLCRFVPLSGGATMIAFRPSAAISEGAVAFATSRSLLRL